MKTQIKHFDEGGARSKDFKDQVTTIGKTKSKRKSIVLPDHFCLRDDSCQPCKEWINKL